MPVPALERPRPVLRAADLLAAYLPGSFYYSSERMSLLADGVHRQVQADGEWAEAAALALDAARTAGVTDPVVAGALGFHPDAETSLVVPAVVRRAGPPERAGGSRPAAAQTPPRAWPGTWSVTPRPEPRDYAAAVRRALTMIDDGELAKVVLARCLELTARQDVAVPALLARLAVANPTAHTFAADVTAPGDRATRTLLGASPELLVRRHGDTVVANPLAGSVPRSADEAEDRRRAAALLASEKDRREHEHVAAQVGEVLGRFCGDVAVPAEPQLRATPTMWHLSSRISGRLDAPGDPAASSLGLATALHPTPAICGVPVRRARQAIVELEAEDRGYYSGLVGWTGPDGDGEWVVTIRSAEVCERTVRLYAGAGVVAGSDPDAELAETSAKFRTLLNAIGLEGTA